ncbi:hypothetical protein [Bacillus sp. OAE603]|uniref:hypothetical protein n=1 Tax=Gottfriedia sp. OAE603 TaxID=2663872 RepID=UPI00178AB1D2
MDHWIGYIFWGLIGSGVFLFVWGLWKKSWQSLRMSGFALILPMLYFGGSPSWLKYLALIPLIPFALSFYTKKRKI